jgi:hypothetical protein
MHYSRPKKTVEMHARGAQLNVRQGHDGMGTDHLGGLARELIGALAPGGAGMSLHPRQINGPASPGSPERRHLSLNSNG